MDGDVKVFDLTVDEMEWQIDALMSPVKALGYNKTWPGPLLRVIEGDKVRVNFTNNLTETTGVHFHGVEFDDFTQDGIPFVTQLPIKPGETFAYEFVARNAGSHMYHSHHNATDQVGRGLLGAFIVEPEGRGGTAGQQVRRQARARRHLHPQRLARRLHDQRPRVPRDRADRGQRGRQGLHPLHERGRDDAPVAHPRVPPAGRGA